MALMKMPCAVGGGNTYERYTLSASLAWGASINIPISGTPKVLGFIGVTDNGYTVGYISDTEYSNTGLYGGYKNSSSNAASANPVNTYFTISSGTLTFTNNIDNSLNVGFEIIIGY